MRFVDLHHTRERDEDRIGLQFRIAMGMLGAIIAFALGYGIAQF